MDLVCAQEYTLECFYTKLISFHSFKHNSVTKSMLLFIQSGIIGVNDALIAYLTVSN